MSSAEFALLRAEVRTPDFHVNRVIRRLCSGMDESGDRVVAPCGLLPSATGGVGSARIKEARLAGSTGHKFSGDRTQPQSERTNMLLEFQGGRGVG